jgi:outer membrane receptor protein involved in Fe transport
MKLQSFAQGDKKVDVNTVTTDLLPSINLVYELTEKINLRGSYAKTLSRPEFREYAPLAYYDIIRNATVVGNDTLTRTLIDNYDFKFEFYPTPGQLFSVNPFYKKFINPVENVLRPGTSTTYSYMNAISAISYGIELEAKTNFQFLSANKSNKFLQNLSLFMNYAYIVSEVKLNNLSSANDLVTNRPMQGQSPYVFNAGLFYSNPIKKFDVSLSSNIVGKRIAYVAPVNYNLIWENPRWVIDASVSKVLFNKLNLKVTFGDILAQPLVFYQDLNKNSKFDAGSDVQTYYYKYGRTIQFAIGYSF